MLDPNVEPADPTVAADQNIPSVGTLPTGTMPAPTPSTGAPTQAPVLSQQQMKMNLQQLMAKINQKYQGFSQNNFTSKINSKKQKDQVLRSIFDFFTQAGVNPSDPQAVGNFLNKLKSSSPELYQQLMSVLQTVMGGDSPTSSSSTPVSPQGVASVPPQGTPPTSPNMNINTNATPQQNI